MAMVAADLHMGSGLTVGDAPADLLVLAAGLVVAVLEPLVSHPGIDVPMLSVVGIVPIKPRIMAQLMLILPFSPFVRLGGLVISKMPPIPTIAIRELLITSVIVSG